MNIQAKNTKNHHKKILQQAIEHICTHDKRLADVIERAPPCSLQAQTSTNEHFISLVRAIIGQQLSTKAAQSIFGRVETFFEQKLSTEISAESLLQCSFDELRALGLSQAKIRSLQDIAEKTHSGALPFEKFSHMSDDEITHVLVSVRGIGTWTAHMFLMFSLVRPDIFPVGDLGIRKAAQNLYELPELPTPETLYALQKRRKWSPYSTYASWYLWRSLEM